MGKCVFVAGIVLLALSAATAWAAFSDDFSDEAASNQLWIPNGDSVKLQFANGTCTVENTDANYSGIASHTFSENEKSSVFTLSGKITLGSASMAAGFVCCLTASGVAPGYYISFRGDGLVGVTKISPSGSGEAVLSLSCAYLTSGTNELKVSKKDDQFNIICNGHFAAKFTDDDFAKGDIALLVSPKTTAVFDDILMTDEFEDVSPPTCFADDFNDGDLAGWSSFGDEGVSARIDANALRITTGEGQDHYQVVDLPLKQFVMKVVVSLHGGNTQKLYGLFICGTPVGTGTIPLAGFGIIGGRSYAAFSAGQSLALSPNSRIRGAPFVSSTGDTTFYMDTLEVIKRDGAADYLFIVNGDTLTKLAGVNFDITGAGMFCLDSLDIVFDDFVVAEGTTGECPVRQPTLSGVREGNPRIQGMVDTRLFDLSGRLIGRGNAVSRTNIVPGVYLHRNAFRPVYRINQQ
ncbi:MAG: hypothetical protein JW913_14220 [Chitinispirillaceae bacterium]|nr:hypothetical protein [Chitinispirillaceae bacterium]